MVMMVSAIEALYSSPPSSLSIADRKFIKTLCFRGNFKHSARIACQHTSKQMSYLNCPTQCIYSDFGGLGVCMLASGTQDCGFAPDRSRRIFPVVNIHSMPSFRGEVK
jgi:hypothetical protein